jgi:hypothetical protein
MSLAPEEALAAPKIATLRVPTVAEGDAAVDFELPLQGGGSVRLSDAFALRPVALVFGSYT